MPMSLVALKRVNSIFEMESQEDQNEKLQNLAAMRLCFRTFLLATISRGFCQIYRLRSARNENVLIEGRTGLRKEHYFASDCRTVCTGLRQNSDRWKRNPEFNRRKYMENVFYISQFYPIIEDTLLNNLVRFYDNYEKQSVELALKITHMDQWMEETKIGLEDTIKPEDFTVNEAQILAWTAALIAKPRILLVDEFDASIDDKILT